MKKKICMILAAIMVVSLCPISALAEYGSSLFELMSTVASGRLSDNITWRFDNEGTLYIDGSGEFYGGDFVPIKPYRDDVSSIVFSNKITKLVAGAVFYGFDNVTSVTIGSGVSYIGDGAFAGCSSLAEISIPKNVIDICYTAFDYTAIYNNADNWDNGLFYVDGFLIKAQQGLEGNCTIMNGTTHIAEYAFGGSAITQVEMPNTVTHIGGKAFNNCSSLNKVIMSDNIIEIGSGAFMDCSSLSEITIPKSVTSISENAFMGCSSLTHVAIPDNIKSIEPSTFEKCASLSEIIVPNSIEFIGSGAFRGCVSLQEITIPENVKTIGFDAFASCTGIENVYFNAKSCEYDFANNDTAAKIDDPSIWSDVQKLILGDKVTKIPPNAFKGCKNLVRVNFPGTLKEIGAYSFYNTGIKQVDIPERTTLIGEATFAHCSALENIFVDSKNPRYYSDNGVLLNNYRNRLLTIPGSKEEYIIPSTVKQIDSYACSGNNKMSEIILSENITTLGENVFLDSTGLESVNYNCETVIPFHNCINLSNVNLGTNVKTISRDAFDTCNKLKELTIPENVKKIYATLESVEVLYWNATDCQQSEIDANIKEIYFGDNVETIPQSFMRNSMAEEIKIPDSITTIKSGAFNNCTNLSEITVPDGVQTIGNSSIYEGAFENCKNLKRAIIPMTVTNIGSKTFSNADSDLTIIGYRNSYAEQFAEENDIMFSALDDKTDGDFTYILDSDGAVLINVDNSVSGNVTIPSTLGGENVTEIGSYAFSGCRNMTGVTIPNTVTRIGINTFYNCSNLTSVNIPDSVNSIGQYAFSGCSRLSTVQLPQNLKSLSAGAFCDCTALEEINIPNTVANIGSHAFERSGLKSVTIPDNVISINNYTFNACKSLEAVELSPNTKNIGSNAFSSTAITDVEIPVTTTKIGSNAFYNCRSLANVVIDNAPVSIDAAAFSECSSLSDVDLGKATKWIGKSVFSNTSLNSLTVPKSVTSIGESTFPTYEDFYINGYIGSCAERYCRINGCMFIKIDQLHDHYYYIIDDGDATITGTDGLLEGSVVLPDTIEGYPVTKIDEKAFMSRKSISDIKIPASITEIAFNAFSDCKGLVLQGNDFVYDYTLKNGLTYTEDLSQTQIEFSNVDSTLEADGDTVSGDVTMELDSNLNSFVDMSNIYLAIYIDGVLTDMVHSSILPEIGETKTVSFKDIGIDNPNHGECTMKVMIWDDMRFRPYAEVYEPQIGIGLQ